MMVSTCGDQPIADRKGQERTLGCICTVRVRRIRSAEAADQPLDAGINVRAIEGGNPRVDERRHVPSRLIRIDVSMVTGQVPAALDDARDRVLADSEIRGITADSGCGRSRGHSERVKRRFPKRVMRNLVGQFGSGQATSASVDIQSFGSVYSLFGGQ